MRWLGGGEEELAGVGVGLRSSKNTWSPVGRANDARKVRVAKGLLVKDAADQGTDLGLFSGCSGKILELFKQRMNMIWFVIFVF